MNAPASAGLTTRPTAKTAPPLALRRGMDPDALHGWVDSSDGTRLHYYVAGHGEPAIVCADGLGCDGYVWRYIARDFWPNHKIVRFHYRGHGQSAAPADRSRMRVEDLTEDLLAVIDKLGVQKAVLLGHSLGVQVILEFYRRHPDRVQALVPVCGSYGRPIDTFHNSAVLRRVFPAVKALTGRFPQEAQKLWSVIDTELSYQIAIRTEVNGELVRREDFRPYLKHLAAMDVQLFLRLLEDAGDHDSLDLLPSIEVPTLIIAGERDTFTPTWLSAVMHARIPGSELCVVPTGTHTAPIELPELVNLRLRRFLEERVGGAAR